MSALSPAIERQKFDPRLFDPRFREGFRPRRRVWAAMLSFNRPFTASDIHSLSGVGLGEVARLLFGWCGRGLLVRGENSTSFTMTDAARERTNPPQTVTKPNLSVPRRSGRQRLWSAMRVLRTFDLPTLCMAASTSEANTRAFIRPLLNARYLGVTGETTARRTLFTLLRDTGPRHPVVRKRTEGALTVIDLDDRNDGSTRRIRTVQPAYFEREVGEPVHENGGGG